MFKINQQLLLNGSRIVLSWKIEPSNGVLILWLPVSKYFWKNYTFVKSQGHINVIFSGTLFKSKLKKISFSGIRTIGNIDQIIENFHFSNVNSPILEGVCANDFANSKNKLTSFKFNVKGLNNSFKNVNIETNSNQFSFKNIED